MERKYITVTETAKLIRETLKIEFPNVKFAVKSKKYSGGASINVKWVDGPTAKQVEAVTSFYEGATFDGMIDMKSYITKTNEGGEQIRYGADHIFCTRNLSIDHVAPFAEYVANHYHLQTPTGETVEHVDYNLQASKYDGDAYISFVPVYFGGRQDFVELVFKLAREYASFAEFIAEKERDAAEWDAVVAEREAKQAQDAKWEQALDTVIAIVENKTAPKAETVETEISEYEQMLIAAGWIDAA